MRVVHVVSVVPGRDGGSIAAAQGLIAGMGQVDPRVEAEVVHIRRTSARGDGPPTRGGRHGSAPVAHPRERRALRQADRFVVSVGSIGEVPEVVQVISEAIRGPLTTLGARLGHLRRRLVLVVPGPDDEGAWREELVAWLARAVRPLGVGEVGVVAGAEVDVTPEPGRPLRSGARRWSGAEPLRASAAS